jgi:hypothetical protein
LFVFFLTYSGQIQRNRKQNDVYQRLEREGNELWCFMSVELQFGSESVLETDGDGCTVMSMCQTPLNYTLRTD